MNRARKTASTRDAPLAMPSAVPLGGASVDMAAPGDAIGVAVLGSTGSVGRQTLDVISRMPSMFRIVALAAGHSSDLLADQVRTVQPDLVATFEPPSDTLDARSVATGTDGLLQVATHPDASIVVVATSGHAAIKPTLAAIEAGKTIALANKETIVCAGTLVTALAVAHGVQIRPVDSEHSALWQALIGARRDDLAGLHLTASGGPFRDLSPTQLESVTARQALKHPTWRMGDKVTIDSATLMNKGLEVLEAHWLFGIPLDDIEVIIHPQSIVHSLVAFADGSQLAQLSLPDMRLPIQFALTYPHHAAGPCKPLSLAETGILTFQAPDDVQFPALELARTAGKQGGTYPTVLSAADEVAVEAFLHDRISFPAITDIIEHALSRHTSVGDVSVEKILEADRTARTDAAQRVATLAR